MTLAVEVVSADGIVIAADSRTTLDATPPRRVLSDFTHKVFQAENRAIAGWGAAFLRGRNIAAHMAEFVAGFSPGGVSVEATAHQLASFFGDRLDQDLAEEGTQVPEGVSVLGFFIGGYEEGIGKTYEVLLPDRAVVERHNSVTNPGAAWRGQTDVIRRLVKGVDWEAFLPVAEQQGHLQHVETLRPILDGLEYLIPFQLMNLQDAIDFAVFAIRTTIDTQRLTYGIGMRPGSWPGVGGPIDIAALTPGRGFFWVQQTKVQGERGAGEAEEL